MLLKKGLHGLKSKRNDQRGFTLVELMATLGILALILAIAVPAVGGIMENAKVRANDSSISMIEHSAQIAHAGDLDYSIGLRGSDENGNAIIGYTVADLTDAGFLDVRGAKGIEITDEVIHDTDDNVFIYIGTRE